MPEDKIGCFCFIGLVCYEKLISRWRVLIIVCWSAVTFVEWIMMHWELILFRIYLLMNAVDFGVN